MTKTGKKKEVFVPTGKKRTAAQMTKDVESPTTSSKSSTSLKRRKIQTKLPLLAEKKREEEVKKSTTLTTRSALHKWAPTVNLKKAAAIDQKKESFACVVGANPSSEAAAIVDFKTEIVAELTKLMNIYKA